MKSNESFELNRLALVSNELDKVAPKKLLSSLVGHRKRKYVFASFNNDRRLSLDDKTKDWVGRNTGSRLVNNSDNYGNLY